MKYLVYSVQALELFAAIVLLFTHGEYPETPLVLLGFFLVLFIIFLLINKKVANQARFIIATTSLSLVIIVVWVIQALLRGQEYFYLNWKGMSDGEYNKTIVFTIVVILMGLCKLWLVRKNSKRLSK